jgi:hypothetical protein
MSFEKDMQVVTTVLDQMRGKFGLAEPSVESEFDKAQLVLRYGALKKDQTKHDMDQVKKGRKLDGQFYQDYGRKLHEMTGEERESPIRLKCFDFNAYIAAKLIDGGFEAPINRGMVGVALLSGHEFLLLHSGCSVTAHERILDYWSHLHTKQPPLARKMSTRTWHHREY